MLLNDGRCNEAHTLSPPWRSLIEHVVHLQTTCTALALQCCRRPQRSSQPLRALWLSACHYMVLSWHTLKRVGCVVTSASSSSLISMSSALTFPKMRLIWRKRIDSGHVHELCSSHIEHKNRCGIIQQPGCEWVPAFVRSSGSFSSFKATWYMGVMPVPPAIIPVTREMRVTAS